MAVGMTAEEGDVATVGRPGGIEVVGGTAGETDEIVGTQIADIDIKIAGFVAVPVEGDAAAIGREGGVAGLAGETGELGNNGRGVRLVRLAKNEAQRQGSQQDRGGKYRPEEFGRETGGDFRGGQNGWRMVGGRRRFGGVGERLTGDGRDEAVTTAQFGLYVYRMAGGITEDFAEVADDGVEVAVEIDVGVVGPEKGK